MIGLEPPGPASKGRQKGFAAGFSSFEPRVPRKQPQPKSSITGWQVVKEAAEGVFGHISNMPGKTNSKVAEMQKHQQQRCESRKVLLDSSEISIRLNWQLNPR